MDALQDAKVVLELGSTQRSGEQESNKKWWTGDAIKFETSGNQEEIVPEPDVSLKKSKVGELDINPGGALSLTADKPNRREPECGK